MNRKLGFTLVELLAVIVILAIILVIAVPSIAGILRSATRGAFESDAKMVLQAIDYKKLEDSNFNPLEISRDNMAELLGLSNENYEQINFSMNGDVVNILIVGQNKWAGFTAYGTMRNMTVVDSSLYDVVPPTISILGDNPINISRGLTYIDEGATAYDVEDGDISVSSVVIRNASNEIVEDIDTSIVTTYTITYIAVDSNGNSTSSVRQINILDTVAPVITMLGSSPVTIHIGDVYNDAGATATDDVDGDITDNIVRTGIVNPTVVGTYVITYDVTDASGNVATQVTRSINVIDISAPVITILGSNPISINQGSAYTDAGATALDDVDGDVTANIIKTGSVNPSIPGIYTITYTVADLSNNQSVAIRTVNVLAPYTITNLILDGSFEESVDGWYDGGSWGLANISKDSTKSLFGSYSMRIETEAPEQVEAVAIYDNSTLSYNSSHKYYAAAYYISPNNESDVVVYGADWQINNVVFHGIKPASNTWQKNSVYIYNSSLASLPVIYFRLDNNNAGQYSNIYYDGAMFIDLTEAFGVGNEPDADWCNANIEYFNGSTIVYK